jgi:hypothetical protein
MKPHKNHSSTKSTQPAVPWEISFICLLIAYGQAGDAHIAWYEKNTRLLAAEIDRCWGEIAELRRGRGERRRAA